MLKAPPNPPILWPPMGYRSCKDLRGEIPALVLREPSVPPFSVCSHKAGVLMLGVRVEVFELSLMLQ